MLFLHHAMDPAVNRNWEDTIASGSSSYKNDGHDLNPSGRSSPDRVCSKPSRGCINSGTWNVRNLHMSGKLDNLIQEAKRLDTDIIAVIETRWTGDHRRRNDRTTQWFGRAEALFTHNECPPPPQLDPSSIWTFRRPWRGRILEKRLLHIHPLRRWGTPPWYWVLKQSLENTIRGYWSFNDRVMLLKINAKPFDLAPTSEHSNVEIEVIYEHVQKAINIRCCYYRRL